MIKMKTDMKIVEIENWSDINWKLVNYTVRNLRRRIFDAKRKNDNKNLRSLQRLMLKSTSNILYCIRKVSYSSGRKTPGIDGQTLDSPIERLNLFKEICRNGWNGIDPKPIRRIYIKEPNKLRPIGIPTIYDRVIQNMIMNSLEPEWEAIFEKGSYGFRPKRNVNDAISRIWLALNKENSRKWIVDSDITKCFDSISHKYLLEQIDKHPAKNIIKKMLEVGIIIRDIWMSSEEEGTPQGSPLSPLLCNIALHGLEEELNVRYTKKGYVDKKGRLLIRFADDLVILCHSRQDAILALEELKIALEKRGLKISELKTKIVHITEGFDFLGFNIKMGPKPHISRDKAIINSNDDYKISYNDVGIYVQPSNKSLKKVKSKLKEVLLKSKGISASKFIRKLNPVIRGYVQSKYHWHSNRSFRHLDHYVYVLCWRWAIRKHPQKGSKWIRRKYFKHVKLGGINNKWVFSSISDEIKNPLAYNDVFVLKTYWFGITDYLLAKMDKLADNKNDEEYFKTLEINRLLRLKVNIFRKLDKDLLLSQNLMCPVCDENIYNGEKLHIHHIIPRSEGGKSTFSNLIYLHLPCHIKIHYEKDNFFRNYLINYKKSHPRPNYKKLRKEDEDYIYSNKYNFNDESSANNKFTDYEYDR